MSASKTGSCLCKRVRFTVTGTDRGAVVCHCVNCQRVSGSAFAHNHQMTGAKVEFASGEVRSCSSSSTEQRRVDLVAV